jgi:hypothetical protein
LGTNELLQLAETPKGNTYFSPEPDSTKPIVERIEQAELLSNRRKQVKHHLEGLKKDIGEDNYCDLLALIGSESIERAVGSQNQRIEKQRKKKEEQRKEQVALSGHGS